MTYKTWPYLTENTVSLKDQLVNDGKEIIAICENDKWHNTLWQNTELLNVKTYGVLRLITIPL